ncbi:hypothetical protein DFH27DRAFT_609745 [Peziza echinospora]|nr:hypothetical protein DFH27DRAFT_609745 [Peziza echinospora]
MPQATPSTISGCKIQKLQRTTGTKKRSKSSAKAMAATTSISSAEPPASAPTSSCANTPSAQIPDENIDLTPLYGKDSEEKHRGSNSNYECSRCQLIGERHRVLSHIAFSADHNAFTDHIIWVHPRRAPPRHYVAGQAAVDAMMTHPRGRKGILINVGQQAARVRLLEVKFQQLSVEDAGAEGEAAQENKDPSDAVEEADHDNVKREISEKKAEKQIEEKNTKGRLIVGAMAEEGWGNQHWRDFAARVKRERDEEEELKRESDAQLRPEISAAEKKRGKRRLVVKSVVNSG